MKSCLSGNRNTQTESSYNSLYARLLFGSTAAGILAKNSMSGQQSSDNKNSLCYSSQ